VIRVDQEDSPAKLLCIELTLAGRTNGGKEREWQDQQGAGSRERIPNNAVTNVALHLAEIDQPGGAHLENLVLHDLLAWRDARIERAELGYWRTSIGEEVIS
jgi:hypothetical protein